MNKKFKRALFAACAVVLAAAVFMLGFFTRIWTQTGAADSLEWALGVIGDKYYEEVDGDFAGVAVDAVVVKYLDIYSEYYTAEEYEAVLQSNAGSKTGIGVTYSFRDGSGALVNSVMGNSPAFKSGLRAGKILVGGSKGGIRTDFDGKDDFGAFIDSVADGESILLFSSDGDTYELAKSQYTASYVFMCTNTTAWTVEYNVRGEIVLVESPADRIEYLPDGAAYIRLLQFYGNAAEEFGRMVEKFNESGCTSLYLDLRENGGGYVSVMQGISGFFVNGGSLVMEARYKDGRTDKYSAASQKTRVPSGTDVFILANNSTASASEALAGALISYGVLGYGDVFISEYGDDYFEWLGVPPEAGKNGRTYGKGIMQETVVNYATGEALKLTTARIYWPNGKTIHDTGLTASDGCTLVQADWSVTLPDTELQRVVGTVAARG